MKAMIGLEGTGKEDMMHAEEMARSAVSEGKSEEDQGFMQLAQGITISPKVMVGFLSALNKVLPLFGLPPLKTDSVSPDLVRAISMIAQAASDASDSEDIPLDLNFSIDDMKSGDQGIIVIAGKLDRLSRTPGFKKFLKSAPATPPSPSEMPPVGDKMAMEKTAEQSPDIEKLFASRM